MKRFLALARPALIAAALFLPPASRAAEASAKDQGPSSETNDRLRKALKQYPDADANKDGVLTMEEGRAFLAKMKSPDGAKPSKETGKPGGAEPTFADVKYGPHERNVLDFWQAKSDKPAPVVVFIHGGGFTAGDKSKARGDKMLQQCLDSGVSFAAINYRYRTTAPLQDVLRDCARAVQFIRSKSGEWSIDKTRLASYGGSAGAGTSLWLAFHDDLADPGNSDPILRESTRLVCAGANSCQFSYDILAWPKLFGEDVCRRFERAGEDWPGFYGLKTDEELNGPVGLKIRQGCDMVGLVSKDDPPVFLSSNQHAGEVTDRGNYLHHPKHAEAVRQRCREIGVECIAQIPGLDIQPPQGKPQNLQEFLFQNLGVKATSSPAAAGQ